MELVKTAYPKQVTQQERTMIDMGRGIAILHPMNRSAFATQRSTACQEIAPRTEYGTEITSLPLCQLGNGSQHIEPRAQNPHKASLRGRSTLKQHREIVAVIEVDFTR